VSLCGVLLNNGLQTEKEVLSVIAEVKQMSFEKNYNYIIVGSGPGGATIAKELSRKTKSILIVEYGPRFAYANLGEFREAIEDYNKAIKLVPKFAQVCKNRGLAYYVNQLPTAACGDFYQAGILFFKQNNTTQALVCVDLMKKADSSSPFTNKLMDQIYP
jgi:tetratricopeptide (TPR) repeat protein